MSIENQNLSLMRSADNYNKWIFNNIKRFIGTRVLEVGHGVGAMTQFLTDKTVTGVDIDPTYTELMKKKYPKMSFINTDLSKSTKEIKPVDSILCINVLEHIQDDQSALDNFHNILENGNLVLVCPAYPSLFGAVDKADNHYRRYTKKDLMKKVKLSGFRIRHTSYMNIPGLLGWWWQGKVLKRPDHKPSSLGLYNKLVPFFEKIEKILKPKFGLSIIMVCEK